MQVFSFSDLSWSQLNTQIRERLGLDTFPGHVLTFQSPYHGVMEATIALSQLFSHKTELVMVPETGPYWRKLASDCTRLGLRTHLIPTANCAQSVGQKFQTKNILAAFTCADDPMLGYLYDTAWCESLKTEKTFCVRVVHNPSQIQKVIRGDVGPYEGYLLVIAASLTVAILGERLRVLPFVAPHLSWDTSALQRVVDGFLRWEASSHSNEQIVRDFESWASSIGATALIQSQPRIYDRYVVQWPDLDGSALRDILVQQKGYRSDQVETLSFCRWPLTQKFDWLLEQGYSVESLRGSLIVSPSVDRAKFEVDLQAAVSEVRALQNG
jgi:hypothetical protein